MPRWMVKALAVTPALAVSTVVTSMVGATLPPLAGSILFVGGLVVGVLLVAGAGESAAARVLLASRPARAEELVERGCGRHPQDQVADPVAAGLIAEC